MGYCVDASVSIGVAVDLRKLIKLVTWQNYKQFLEMLDCGVIEIENDYFYLWLRNDVLDSLERLEENEEKGLKKWIKKTKKQIDEMISKYPYGDYSQITFLICEHDLLSVDRWGHGSEHSSAKSMDIPNLLDFVPAIKAKWDAFGIEYQIRLIQVLH